MTFTTVELNSSCYNKFDLFYLCSL